ncbi:hypothetical protein NKH95_17525 [Mesorhizobium sp. M0848]|uniref:hypothetical protein n=1 Tax=Mesorhizobium sp. M0848 TaxID=2957012 RepID=UPI003334E771
MPAILTIPGIGTFQPTFDAVNICTDVPKDQLEQILPKKQLEQRSHAFQIENRHGRQGSRLKIVCLPGKAVLRLLKKHEAALGSYWANKVEAAFDLDAGSVKGALLLRDWQLRHLDKVNHKRGYIGFVSKAKKGPSLTAERLKRRGLFDHPTVYFEHDKAAHNLKIYIRRRKLALRQFGSIITRLEWTSKGRRAVKAHFGGDQLSDLINANLESYLHRFLVLEQIDYVKLGKQLSPRTVMRHAKPTNARANAVQVTALFRSVDYRARRVAHLAIKVLEQREWPQIAEVPEEVWRSSPAQIKGRFRNALRKMQARRRAKKPASRRRQRHPLTMKKLQTCFTRIPLRRNRIWLRKRRP